MNQASVRLKQRSLVVCVQSTTLSNTEKKRLQHPFIAGVILFSRNFESSHQLKTLIKEIRQSSKQDLLILVDNEGGRVQRFKTDEFTHLPAMLEIARFVEANGLNEKHIFSELGYLMATEAVCHGIDLSLAPVLDVDNGSDVVGDRAFSSSACLATKYASSFILGMRQAGMSAVGKHFPGHGSTKEDSHFHTPIDNRSLAQLKDKDLIPFTNLINAEFVDGIMPAHILFPKVADKPVGFSDVWVKQILKGGFRFMGAVFSDDLAMAGASQLTNKDGTSQKLSYKERLLLATEAGCDFLLICNQPEIVDEILETINEKDLAIDDRLNLLISHLQNDAVEVDESRVVKSKQLVSDIKAFVEDQSIEAIS